MTVLKKVKKDKKLKEERQKAIISGLTLGNLMLCK